MLIALIFFYRNYQKLTMRSALLCQAKHHIVLSGDAFLQRIILVQKNGDTFAVKTHIGNWQKTEVGK